MKNSGLIKQFIAATAIPKNRVVKLAAGDNEVALATDVADPLIGISEEPQDIAAGQRIDVTFSGIVEVEAGAALAKNADVTVDTQGRAVASSASTDSTIGRALTAANTAGDIISIEIQKG